MNKLAVMRWNDKKQFSYTSFQRNKVYFVIFIIVAIFIVLFTTYIKAIGGSTYIASRKLLYYYKHSKRKDGQLGYYKCSGMTPIKYIQPSERKILENIHYMRQVNDDNDYKEDIYDDILLKIRSRMPLQEKTYRIATLDIAQKHKLCEFIRRKEPVIIKGMAKDTRASSEWNVLDFIHEYGHNKVLFSNKDGEFTDSLSSLVKEDGRYCHNMEQLFYKYPKLRDDLDFNKILHEIQGCCMSQESPICYAQQFFISNTKGTGVMYHNAEEDNFFTMIQGRKKWTFVDPQWTLLFSPYFNRCAMYFSSKAGHAYNPNLDRCPLYHHIPKWEAVLEPGDVLYNPSYWWHSIENIDKYTMGVSSRWVFETEQSFNGHYPSTCYELTDIQHSLYAIKHLWYFGFKNLQNIPLSSFLKKENILNQTYTNENSEYQSTFWEEASHCSSKYQYGKKYDYLRLMKNENPDVTTS